MKCGTQGPLSVSPRWRVHWLYGGSCDLPHFTILNPSRGCSTKSRRLRFGTSCVQMYNQISCCGRIYTQYTVKPMGTNQTTVNSIGPSFCSSARLSTHLCKHMRPCLMGRKNSKHKYFYLPQSSAGASSKCDGKLGHCPSSMILPSRRCATQLLWEGRGRERSCFTELFRKRFSKEFSLDEGSLFYSPAFPETWAVGHEHLTTHASSGGVHPA